MVKTFGKEKSGNIVDRRVSTGNRGQSFIVGLITVLGGGALGLGVAGVEQTLCFAGLQACPTPLISPERKTALDDLSSSVLRATEVVWTDAFAAEGRVYREPTLVLYDAETTSECGVVRAGGSPSYCIADEHIFLDLSYFHEISSENPRLGGDFAPTFVIAHEVGHHVQKLVGGLDRLELALRGEGREGINQVMVRIELQADCYAGVWTKRAQDQLGLLEDNDLREAVALATFAGDDTQQIRARGFVDESAFQHGSAEQRVRWFTNGYDGGTRESCDTFSPAFTAL